MSKTNKEIGTKPKLVNIPIEKLVLYEYSNQKPKIPYETWLKEYIAKLEKDEWFQILNEDITNNGTKTPLLVIKEKDGTFTVKDGRNRVCIAVKNNLKTLPCIVINNLKPPYWLCSELKTWKSRFIGKA